MCLIDVRQDLMRQSTDLSEDQVRKSVGGVGDFLRNEESDESPAARDTVGLALANTSLEPFDTEHVRQSSPQNYIPTTSLFFYYTSCSSWPRFLDFKPVSRSWYSIM